MCVGMCECVSGGGGEVVRMRRWEGGKVLCCVCV